MIHYLVYIHSYSHGKESIKVQITQKIGKERGNSYLKKRKSPGKKHIQTHGSLIETYQHHRSLSRSEESKCM